MVRPPSFDSRTGMKKGAWSEDEDNKLRAHIQTYGHRNWRLVPISAGLARCGKSCRLRWVNYLKPGLRRGNFTKHEEDLIIGLHAQLGNRWSAIAAKLHGRTDNEIKNHWHAHLKKRCRIKGNTASCAAADAATTIQSSEPNECITSTTSDFGYHHHHQREAGLLSVENSDQTTEANGDLAVEQAHQQWDLSGSWAAGNDHQQHINVLDGLPFSDQELRDLELVCQELIMMDVSSNCSDYSSNYSNTGMTSSAESQGSFSSDIFGDEDASYGALLWGHYEPCMI